MIKTRFIIALIFVCVFLAVSAFVVVYSLFTRTNFWDSYQPYFTAMIGPVGIILGYYFNNQPATTTTTQEVVSDSPVGATNDTPVGADDDTQ